MGKLLQGSTHEVRLTVQGLDECGNKNIMDPPGDAKVNCILKIVNPVAPTQALLGTQKGLGKTIPG